MANKPRPMRTIDIKDYFIAKIDRLKAEVVAFIEANETTDADSTPIEMEEAEQ